MGCPPHSNYLDVFLRFRRTFAISHSTELKCANSSPISNCQHSKSAIFISCNINWNINSLLWLRIGTHYLSIYLYIYRTSITYRKWKRKQYRGCHNTLLANNHSLRICRWPRTNFKMVPNGRMYHYLTICHETRCYKLKHKSYN